MNEITVTIPDTQTTTQEQPQVEPTAQSSTEQTAPETHTAVTPQADLQASLNEQAEARAEVKTTLETKGIDYDAAVNEYMDKGKLSDETYKKFEDAGFPKSVVDSYTKGVEAINEQFVNQVFNYAGGQKEYEAMCAFVNAEGETSVKAFTNLIDKGDLTTISLAMDGIKARMAAKNGTANSTVLGNNSSVSSGFTNLAEMSKAMSDPRYSTDKAYRESVVQKLTASKDIVSVKSY